MSSIFKLFREHGHTTINVILSPSLFVILNEVKDLEGLRINFAKDLIFMNFRAEARFFAPTKNGGSE
jgi:hypothetical protein